MILLNNDNVTFRNKNIQRPERRVQRGAYATHVSGTVLRNYLFRQLYFTVSFIDTPKDAIKLLLQSKIPLLFFAFIVINKVISGMVINYRLSMLYYAYGKL
jgi:hypothetical protein